MALMGDKINNQTNDTNKINKIQHTKKKIIPNVYNPKQQI